MKASRSSPAICMLLASTSSGVRAAFAEAIFMIMCVNPGPSVPEQAVTSPVTREKPAAAAATGAMKFRRDGRASGSAFTFLLESCFGFCSFMEASLFALVFLKWWPRRIRPQAADIVNQVPQVFVLGDLALERWHAGAS